MRREDIISLVTEVLAVTKKHPEAVQVAALQLAQSLTANSSDVSRSDTPVGSSRSKPIDEVSEEAGFEGKLIASTVNSILIKQNGSSAKDVLMAAAAKLTLVDKKDTFSRQELLDTMQTGTQFYKSTMSGNLSSTIKSAVKGSLLNEPKDSVYAMTSAALYSYRSIMLDD